MGEVREKCRQFRDGGVDVCWLIDPEARTVEVFEGGRDADPLPADGAFQSPFLSASPCRSPTFSPFWIDNHAASVRAFHTLSGGSGMSEGQTPGRPTLRLQTVNIDCLEAEPMADFYGRLLGWEITYRDEDFILMHDPSGGTGLSFQAWSGYRPPTWPEMPGEQHKMLHLDIRVDDLGAAVAHALACGGRLAEYQGRDDLRVMLDPAGHPFCLFLE